MGYNTTVVIVNDALDIIENNPNEFVTKLVDKIQSFNYTENKYFSVGNHANPVSVVGVHHSSETAVIAVGGNSGSIIGRTFGHRHVQTEDKIQILKDLADDFGYTLRKKPGNKNNA
jgi:hypothetical protein